MATASQPIRILESIRKRGKSGAPGLSFEDPFIAVLHALFDDGPYLRIATLPFCYRDVAEVRQIGYAYLAREESTDHKNAQLTEERCAWLVFFGGPLRVGNAV